MKIPDSLKDSISSKVLGKSGASKVSSSSDALKSINSITDNFNFLPKIAKSLNITRQNIFKLVKLEGGKPVKADNNSDSKDVKIPTLELKTKSPTPEKEESSFAKGQRFASFFLDILSPKKILSKLSIGTIFLAAGIITLLKDAFIGLAEFLWEEIKTAFTGFVESVKQWFEDVVQPILDDLKKFLENVWKKITDFFKPIFEWVGEKIKIIIEYLQPVFDFMKKVLDKVMVVFNAIADKLAWMKPYYDGLIEKINKVTNLLPDSVKSMLGIGEKKPEVSREVKGPLERNQSSTSTSTSETAAEKAKKNLTPSQLKWLGGADPTDPYIMARIPPPQPGEKGGPSAEKPGAAAGAPSGPAPVISGKPSGGGMGSLDDTKKMIIRHEGMKDMPYKDSLGLWTIGVGHLIGDGKTLPPEYNRKFTNAEIMKMFDDDFDHHAKAAEKIPGYSKANQQGQGALIDLTFNMGPSWYKKWPSFCKKLSEGDFKGAADELASSKWAQQVKSRAQTIIGLITGAGEGGASPTPVGGETKVASASSSPAPAPAYGAPGGPAKVTAPAPMTEQAPAGTGGPTKTAAGGGSLSTVVKTQSGVDLGGFATEFEKRVAAMAADFKVKTGKTLLVTSGFRTNEKQKTLFDEMVAKLGGDKFAAKKKVAEPMPPLGQGKGSFHLKGLAIDINSKGSDGLNALAGSRDKPTGWLESFGLTRPVVGEDWHVQATGLAPTPDNPVNPGAPTLVAGSDGKPMDLASGKIENLPEAKSSDNSTGSTVASASTEVAASQRQQQKPTTPIIINAPTTNTTTITKNESVRSPNEKKEDANGTLLSRLFA